MAQTLNFETILSDPLLMIAVALLVLGPLIFFVAFIQYLRASRKPQLPPLMDSMEGKKAEQNLATPLIIPAPYIKEVKEEPPPPMAPRRNMSADSEKTVVMAPGTGEVQGQLEIAFSQIKTLSRKVAQLESELDTLSRAAATKLEANELKEVPMNPADFTQKLLKLAEHVIVLEKEVARIKSPATPTTEAPPPAPAEPSTPKPPVMPI